MNPPRRHIVVGTAGHIDHGKSSLVRALTGIDPDRLKEEKERGITIDLGFAHLTLPDGTRLGFVDVPGHERFVKNMLAGVGGIDMVLLIVAADESIKPQTREHFDICRLLRIRHGLVVLTKADLVEPDILDLVRLEVREYVAGSFLESAPVIAASSRTGEGLDGLRSALQEIASRIEPRPAGGLPRLPVDRSFGMKGFGSVVTGTLIAGTLREGEEVEIQPRRSRAKVRGLQVFGSPTPLALPGQRTAVNLQGVDVGEIRRGDLLTAPGILEPSHVLDAAIEILPGAGRPLKDLSRVRFHHGTLEAMARVRLVESREIPPGGRGFAQLRLETPVTALPGDRFIVRHYSPAITIGGGTVLDNRPPKLGKGARGLKDRFERLASPDLATRLGVLVEEAGAAGIDAAGFLSRTGLDATEIGPALDEAARSGRVVALDAAPRRYLSARAASSMTDAVISLLKEFHLREPLQEGLPREEVRTRVFARSHPDVFRCLLQDLATRGILRISRDRTALSSHRIELSARETEILEAMEDRYRQAGTNPPDAAEMTAALKSDAGQVARLLHLLLARGRVVKIQDGKVFHAEALEGLKRRLWERRAANPVIDISDFKDLSGTSRKNAIPLLEHFDQTHVTRREGNRRVILPPPMSAPAAGGSAGGRPPASH
jgi:selenocysteine-specific elongation factor